MKTLNVMSIDFTYKAALRGYESAIVKRVWNGIGSLSITINSQITNADLIAIDDIIWFDQEYHNAFIVEQIEETLTGSNVYYSITASHLNSLLRDFVTIPPSGQAYDILTGTREAVARDWVDNNCITPADALRAQYPIVLGAAQGLGATITDQTRYASLVAEVSRILSPEDLSFNIDLDIANHQFVFKVLEGKNRTSIQSVNSRILFGLKYGNISEYRKVTDSSGEKNVIYVGGNGDGPDQSVVKVDASGSGRKKEAYFNAKGADNTELAERGEQAIAEKSKANTYEFESLNRQFTYGVDYDLGDYVTVVIDKDTYSHLQIRQITESYEKGKIRVIPEFGKTERTMTGELSSVASRVSSLETVVPEYLRIAVYDPNGIKADVFNMDNMVAGSTNKFVTNAQISKWDLGYTGGTALPATTGTITATMDGAVKKITPTGNCVFNAAGGTVGQTCSFIITTSGTTAYTLTWSSNFKPAGTLSTGTVSGKVFSISFIYDGTTWIETGRTAAM